MSATDTQSRPATPDSTDQIPDIVVYKDATYVGNLTKDLELKFSANGRARAKGTLAVNSRHFDAATNSWVDDEPLFLSLVLWGDDAENTCTSTEKGSRLMVRGDLKMRQWHNKDNPERIHWQLELNVKEVGASLKWATVEIAKVQRTNGRGSTAQADFVDDEPF